MYSPSITATSIHQGSGEPRIVEHARGTAHPTGGATTRDRVARSLLLRPDISAAARPLTRR